MLEIIKICSKHGALTRQDVQFRKNRTSSDCKHCSNDWRKKDKILNPDKYKKYTQKYKKIILNPEINDRTCCRCKKIFLFHELPPSERDNRYVYCSQCRSIANRISKIRNKDTYEKYKEKSRLKEREKSLIKKYGINLEQYQMIHDSQKGLCKICGNTETSLQPNGKDIKDLCVDHCHKTNKVRGLLCHNCNAGIGHFNDDVKKLQSAIIYLS